MTDGVEPDAVVRSMADVLTLCPNVTVVPRPHPCPPSTWPCPPSHTRHREHLQETFPASLTLDRTTEGRLASGARSTSNLPETSH